MIGVSMRMERVPVKADVEEARDCLAADWRNFLHKAMPDETFVPVPNLGHGVIKFLETLPFSGFIFSGGDDWGIFPERDLTESQIYKYAEVENLPIVGICRGAQVLNLLNGGRLSPGFGNIHAGMRHTVNIDAKAGEKLAFPLELEVNSYHNLAIAAHDLAPGFYAWAQTQDGSVEAYEDTDGRLCGVMWHPERERPFSDFDTVLLKHYLGK